MSYLQRTSTESCFAQVYNASSTWSFTNRPDTKTQNWLSPSGTNGYSFTGNGYIFGFLVATSTVLGRSYIGANNFYTSGIFAYQPNTGWATSNDEMIFYGSRTEHYQGTTINWPLYSDLTRFNIIRLESL